MPAVDVKLGLEVLGVVLDVVLHEGGDEVVAVVVVLRGTEKRDK